MAIQLSLDLVSPVVPLKSLEEGVTFQLANKKDRIEYGTLNKEYQECVYTAHQELNGEFTCIRYPQNFWRPDTICMPGTLLVIARSTVIDIDIVLGDHPIET